MMLPDLATLHAIHQLKYRYVRGLDTQDWALVARCFTADARVWYNDGKFTQSGRENIIAFLASLLDGTFYSSHIVLHPEIEMTGPDSATGIWRLQDIVHFTGANPAFGDANIEGGEEMTGAGYYYDDYVREAEGWKIASMGYSRLFEQIERPQGRAVRDLDINLSRGVPAVS